MGFRAKKYDPPIEGRSLPATTTPPKMVRGSSPAPSAGWPCSRALTVLWLVAWAQMLVGGPRTMAHAQAGGSSLQQALWGSQLNITALASDFVRR